MQNYNTETYKYATNYAWPGITTILYNIYDTGINYALQSINTLRQLNITDIGFAYKTGGFDQYDSNGTYIPANADSGFTEVSITQNDSDVWDYKESAISVGSNIMLLGTSGSAVVSSQSDWNGYNFPYCVALKNLQPNTEYTVCGYVTAVVKDGSNGTLLESHTVFFNIQTITTMQDENKNVTWQKGSGWGELTESQQQSASGRINEMIDILNQMCNLEQQFTINVSTDTAGGAAVYRGGGVIDIKPGSITSSRVGSIILHEMGHGLMVKNEEHTNKEMQFMEWATGLPKAKWMWLGGHNYPVISSGENESERDAYKRAAAYQVSTETSLETQEFFLQSSDQSNTIYGTLHGNTYDFGEIPANLSRIMSNIPWSNTTTGWSHISQYTTENNMTVYDLGAGICTWSVGDYNFRAVLLPRS